MSRPTATSWRSILLAALVALATLVAPSAAAAPAPPIPPPPDGDRGPSSLVLSFSQGETIVPVDRFVRLRCEPPGGTHPHTAEACAALARAGGDFGELEGNPGPCPALLNPVTVSADGHYQGEPVFFQASFTNRCKMLRELGVVFRFAPGPGRDCGDVAFAPNSGAGAFEITARGVGCELARDVAARAEGQSGEVYTTPSGFTCRAETQPNDLVTPIHYTCTRPGAVVTFET